jgi:hypothetical protein
LASISDSHVSTVFTPAAGDKHLLPRVEQGIMKEIKYAAGLAVPQPRCNHQMTWYYPLSPAVPENKEEVYPE